MSSENASLAPEQVGVIDVGSNTIKLLVASRGEKQSLKVDALVVEDTRIGEGISGRPPKLDDDAIQRGAAVIERLFRAAGAARPISIVATSAVRDAVNRASFIEEVRRRCGQQLRVLTGEEEARLIGIGLGQDPSIRDIESFTLIDLGGGSLECIHYVNRKPVAEESLQLGSVRLASMLLTDRHRPLDEADQHRIARYVKEQLQASSFQPGSSPSGVAVLTGGSASHLGETVGQERRERGLSLQEVSDLRATICKASLEKRVEALGIPRSRADIFPTAMVTLETCLRYLACSRARFSHYNLRYGAAALLLEKGALDL